MSKALVKQGLQATSVRGWLLGVSVVGVLSAPAVALGQVDQAGPEQADYEYTFTDDLLNSDVFAPVGEPIRVRRPIARVLLIRARTHFVPELQKSIEQL